MIRSSESNAKTPFPGVVLGETWRARRAENKRRDGVKEALEQHEAQLQELEARIVRDRQREEESTRRERELEKVVEEVRVLLLLLVPIYCPAPGLTRKCCPDADRLNRSTRWLWRAVGRVEKAPEHG